MKKLLTISALLLSTATIPCLATLSTDQSVTTLEKSAVLTDNPQLSSVGSENRVVAENDRKTPLLLSFNASQPIKDKPLATTELKINLDNFDMEYILKVQ